MKIVINFRQREAPLTIHVPDKDFARQSFVNLRDTWAAGTPKFVSDNLAISLTDVVAMTLDA